ncbi:DsbA family protein [Polycladidibacter hongkongensis]|uniref:DsbA family protein n=1 Tax=Polycladidibacter hongkongensis TaxID=1647556 RepID=UPI00082F7FD6|nr:DsbA family protein [Pseudovibrio hongkongensis]
MTFTRRDLLSHTGTALLGASTLALGLAPVSALAQSQEDLAQASPLGDMQLGSADAPVTVIEYASMTCGHCASFHKDTFKAFKDKYIDTGKVRFIFREFPLDPVAAAASMMARCQPQDKYFATLSTMFDQQRNWAFTDNPYGALLKLGQQLGMSKQQFEECLTNQEILDGVTATRNHASNKLGVDSTPTFFINGDKQSGALSIEQLSEQVDKHL